jgi:DNA-binding NarL/FixJ family response regulator
MAAERPILIVEDHDLFSMALRSILPGTRDVQTARTLAEAQQRCAALQPDVVLLDVELPDGDGVERLPLLKAAAPAAHFIVVSRHDSAAVVRAAFDNGADGFLEKGLSAADFADGLRRAILEKQPVWPAIEDTSGLTKREIGVLHSISQFKSDKDAARALEIAPDTLRGHLKRIYRKLGVHSRVQAIAESRRRRLIP